MIVYRTVKWGHVVTPVEVVRTTEQSIFLRKGKDGEQRRAKSSEYDNYWDTWEGARNYLRRRTQDEIDRLERKLESARAELAAIEAMPKP